MSEASGPAVGRPAWIQSADPFATGAGLLADAVEEVASTRPVRLAIPGGSAARAAREAMSMLQARGFDFSKLLLTWVDERCVPEASPESNRGTSDLDPVPDRVLPLYLDGEGSSASLERVGRLLADSFQGQLDVVLLGMGSDGHIASLFVGTPLADHNTDSTALVAYVGDSPKPPAERMTLTRPLLATAKHTILVAVGPEKRSALMRLHAGDPELPGSGLPGLVICTDQPQEESP